jgi:serine/threonine protein kinase
LDELQAGDPQQVGGYTLLARLGSGGMGQVYFGRSAGGRHVAVKVIRPDLAKDRSFRLRFAREVEAARRVSGAFTAPVIDADPDASIPWLVTDYVHGPSLAEAVGEYGALPLFSVLALAARLAEGLSAVHAAGVIHRDLKPANVLLAEDGPRLIDFGISQAADFAQITSATSVLGTPGFIAPELITGELVKPSSDIFTMGAVLAYAATGELPFGGGPPDARTLRVLYVAPDLDHVPGELRPLVERCMDKDPANRPSAKQFLADLIAAHPDAADRGDWLPEAILAEIRRRPLPEREMPTSHLRITPHAMRPAPASESRWKRWMSHRPRIWITGAVAAAVGLMTGIGLLAVPSGTPPTRTGALAAATSSSSTGQIADAAFNWAGDTDTKEALSSDTYWQSTGKTWQDPWAISSDCGEQACGATLEGSINGISFNAKLARSGATYTGSAAVNNFWLDCMNTKKFEHTTLSIHLTATTAARENGQWTITAFAGTVTWNVPALPDGCAGSLYQMQVTGKSS